MNKKSLIDGSCNFFACINIGFTSSCADNLLQPCSRRRKHHYRTPGQPQLRIRVLHYTWSSNHVIGAGDDLIVYLKAVAGPPVNNWIPVACIVENPSFEEWEKALFSNMPLAGNTLLVKHSDLQIHKVGKNDVFAFWKESLTAEITGVWATWLGVSSVTLPPGSLLIQGYGEELTGSLGPIPPNSPKPLYDWGGLDILSCRSNLRVFNRGLLRACWNINDDKTRYFLRYEVNE